MCFFSGWSAVFKLPAGWGWSLWMPLWMSTLFSSLYRPFSRSSSIFHPDAFCFGFLHQLHRVSWLPLAVICWAKTCEQPLSTSSLASASGLRIGNQAPTFSSHLQPHSRGSCTSPVLHWFISSLRPLCPCVLCHTPGIQVMFRCCWVCLVFQKWGWAITVKSSALHGRTPVLWGGARWALTLPSWTGNPSSLRQYTWGFWKPYRARSVSSYCD